MDLMITMEISGETQYSRCLLLCPGTHREGRIFDSYVHHANRLGQTRLSIGPVKAAEPRREACNLGLPGLWQVSGSTEMLMRDAGSEWAPG